MSLEALSDYTIYSKYAHFLPNERRRETWPEIVDRVFKMHQTKYEKFYNDSEEFRRDFEEARELVKDKKVLGSQRAWQFGGDGILKNNAKIFNCTSTLIDRPRAFQEIGYLLLCGCGVGYSIQSHHVKKLPTVKAVSPEKTITFTPEDSIEGWAECWGVLINSYFNGGICSDYEGATVEFDLSQIRPEGALIAGQFKAPGPEPLRKSLVLIKAILDKACANGERQLKPIEIHDIICHIADGIISGGVRRSALICLFDKHDKEMAECKTGEWFYENPQRGRANNSVVLERGKTTKEEFNSIFENIKSFGEPGFYFVDDGAIHQSTNPCCEIGFWPLLPNGQSGFGGCNLTEINGAACVDKKTFFKLAKAAAFLGTLQAGYTDFPYLGEVTEEIFRTEALLGVSITGWMNQPDILFNKKNLIEAVEVVRQENQKIAAIIGINPAARLTCTKPSGNASCLLQTGSGIHADHSPRFLRRVQVNKKEFAGKIMKKKNPISVVESVWSANKSDLCISFPCEPNEGSLFKKDLSGVEFLGKIKQAFEGWVLPGTNKGLGLDKEGRVTHNISCTVNVREGEWDEVRDYIYKNRFVFSGISLLAGSGDLDYDQAPFVEVLNAEELVGRYGDAVPLASGLIVDGLHAFGNLWVACDAIFGIGSKIKDLDEPHEPVKPSKKKFKNNEEYLEATNQYSLEFLSYYKKYNEYEINNSKKEWVRRAKQFAERYFGGDIKRMTYCLKHVSIWKDWLDINREWSHIDWSSVKESQQEAVNADTLAANSCHGGACELTL